MVQIVGIDADDTLWDEASAFDRAENRFVEAVAGWTGDLDVRDQLRALHFALIDRVGYGPAGYRIAIDSFCDNRVPAAFRGAAKGLAQAIFNDLDKAVVTPLPGVVQALAQLSRHFPLVLLSKGDEAHQRRKLDASGLGGVFRDVRIVREKTASVYRATFGDTPSAMIGNSLKSDILPALEAGAFGLYVPFHRTSPLEQAAPPTGHDRFRQFLTLEDAADWLCAHSGGRRGRR